MNIRLLLSLLFLMGQHALFANSLPLNQLGVTTKQNLLDLACQAREKAYAPYSHYFVGSALLTSEGRIFQGCNVENASYGLSCCSERVALFKAVSEGATDVVAIAIATKEGNFPCGTCRQVLNEFNPSLIVLISNENGHLIHETTLSALLPNAFGSQNLD